MGDGERIVIDPKSTLWQARFGDKKSLREIFRKQRGHDLLGDISKIHFTGTTIALHMTDGSIHELKNEDTNAAQ